MGHGHFWHRLVQFLVGFGTPTGPVFFRGTDICCGGHSLHGGQYPHMATTCSPHSYSRGHTWFHGWTSPAPHTRQEGTVVEGPSDRDGYMECHNQREDAADNAGNNGGRASTKAENHNRFGGLQPAWKGLGDCGTMGGAEVDELLFEI